MNDIMIETKNLTKYYPDGKVNAVIGINLTVNKGEFLVIHGPSGSGKSTLLYLLSGLDRPTSGEVFFDGKPLKDALDRPGFRAAHVGFIFQQFYLWPTLDVIENVLLPIFDIRIKQKKVRDRAISLLALVGISDKINSSVQALSVGQRQRVAIARALISDPQVVFADEPTGSLDSQNTNSVLELFSRIHKEQGVTLIMATHQHAADKLSDRIINIIDGKLDENAAY
jgi:putative ABC transport system ATP-binding protein